VSLDVPTVLNFSF